MRRRTAQTQTRRRRSRKSGEDIDQKKVERLRKRLESGQLGIDFDKLVDGLTHALQKVGEAS